MKTLALPLAVLFGGLLTGCRPEIGQCYTSRGNQIEEPLAEVTEVLDYGVFWKTKLPTDNPNAYTSFYTTFEQFERDFIRADCWAKRR